MLLWLTTVTVDLYKIISHVMLLSVTNYSPLARTALCQCLVLAHCGRFTAFVLFCTSRGSDTVGARGASV